MNRNNIWIHVSIAVVIITIAAVLGQIDRWRSALKGPETQVAKTIEIKAVRGPLASDERPEVLVRFKPGVS